MRLVDQLVDRRPLRTHALQRTVDDDLRRVDEALVEGARVAALPFRIRALRERILPADIVPVVDVQAERQHVLPRCQLAEIGVGRRAGVAALAGEQLDHHRPALLGMRRGHPSQQGTSDQQVTHAAP
jgi:hypothetical protein